MGRSNLIPVSLSASSASLLCSNETAFSRSNGDTPMKINVTWSDIRNGRAGRTTECMVALALKRELGVEYASVGYGGGSVLIDGKLLALYLPLAIRNRIRFWDNFHFVLPF